MRNQPRLGGDDNYLDYLAHRHADQIPVDPQARRTSPRHKSTRRWCKGKVGVEHQPVIMAATGMGTLGNRPLRRCGPSPSWMRWAKNGWSCFHEERCGKCGKILRTGWELDASECPEHETYAQ